MALVAPPSPKRAKSSTYLASLLDQIRAQIAAGGYEPDVRVLLHRAGNLYGYVQAKRRLAIGEGFLTLVTHLYYDGTYATEVQAWTKRAAGRLPGGILRKDAPLKVTASFVAGADLPAAIAWTGGVVHRTNVRVTRATYAQAYDAAKLALDTANGRNGWKATVEALPLSDGKMAEVDALIRVSATFRATDRTIALNAAFHPDGSRSGVIAWFDKQGAAATEAFDANAPIERALARAEDILTAG